MDQTRDEVERMKSQVKNPVGAVRDMQNLGENTSASVDELREFVAGLKGRSPQEVLGIVTQNSLFQGVVHATIGSVVVLAVFTVGPWAWNGGRTAEGNEVQQQVDELQDQYVETQAAETAASTDAADAQAGTSSTASSVDPAGAAAAMGIDEVKDSDAESNPLDTDTKLDSLLDGL